MKATQLKLYAAAVLLNEEKVLLAKRTTARSNYPGNWDFVGGHCEGDETFETAMKREVLEEIGVEPEEFALLMVVDESPEFILNLFLATQWKGNVSNRDEREHERIEWFELSEAKLLEFENDNYLSALEMVQQILRSRPAL